LADLADVVGPEDNCEDSGNVLANLDRWLGAGGWWIIHFNCGLHDVKSDRGTAGCACGSMPGMAKCWEM